MTELEITEAAIAAKNEALIAGAPVLDAAWIGIETIDRLVREDLRRRLNLQERS